jgi:very-short-patch-repair endonuclease
MSLLCDQVIQTLKEVFPEIKVKLEKSVVYRGQRLYIDIWVPQFNLVIEVHGRQHDEFVKHFHGDEAGFKSSKKRDSIKEDWAIANGYTFVAIRGDQLPVTKESLLEILLNADDNG